MDGLAIIKNLFNSADFKNLSREDQQKTIDQILTITGNAFSREQVMSLYYLSNFSLLENLSYDMFRTIVLSHDIVGRDLLNLCNTSTKMRAYCNKDFVRSDGVILNKYLFRLLLGRLGIEVPLNDDPKRYYKYYTKYGKAYESLTNKLRRIIEIENIIYVDMDAEDKLPYPHDLFSLLYGEGFGFFRNSIPKGFSDIISDSCLRITVLIYNIVKSINPYELEGIEYTVENLANILKISINDLIANHIMKYDIYDRHFISLDYHTMAKNFAECFRTKVLSPHESYNLFEMAKDKLKTIINMIDNSKDDWLGGTDISEEEYADVLELLRELKMMKLTQDEAIFLVSLHQRIKNGDLKINTLFKFENLVEK